MNNARFIPRPDPGPGQSQPGPFRAPPVKAAIAMGAVFVVLIVAVFAWRILHVVSAVRTSLSEAEKVNRRVAVKNQLKDLGVQFAYYESKYHAYPPDEASFRRYLQESPKPALADFKCGQCGEKITLLSTVAPSGTWAESSGYPYSWSATGITDAAPPDLPVAWHRCPEQEYMIVLFFQGRVDSFQQGSDTVRKLEGLGQRR